MRSPLARWLRRVPVLVCLADVSAGLCTAAPEPAAHGKPVLLYSRYYNAEGETRYLPDGTFKGVLARLRAHFEVRVNAQPLTEDRLREVAVLWIVNPSDAAVPGHPAPPHVSSADAKLLDRFVAKGGGLIVMGNQENHNLEIHAINGLLGRFGLQFTNRYTDAKKLVVPREAPLIGGLRWAYYTGNSVLIDSHHPAHPRSLIDNDLAQTPAKGPRDESGSLLAIAEPGRGRVAVVTDSGWLSDDALSGKGIAGVAIVDQDNWEIFRRLAQWTAGHSGPR